MILFYTKKAGFKPKALKKLEAAGITAVECDHVDELHWADPSRVDWVSKNDAVGVMFIRALSASHGGAEQLGRVMLGAMRSQHNISLDGSVKTSAK